jgi:hypothetical protein
MTSKLRQQVLDTTTPAGKAMFQMVGVFAGSSVPGRRAVLIRNDGRELKGALSKQVAGKEELRKAMKRTVGALRQKALRLRVAANRRRIPGI